MSDTIRKALKDFERACEAFYGNSSVDGPSRTVAELLHTRREAVVALLSAAPPPETVLETTAENRSHLYGEAQARSYIHDEETTDEVMAVLRDFDRLLSQADAARRTGRAECLADLATRGWDQAHADLERYYEGRAG